MSLSLCMIVKDEEDNLPRCLESVKDIVDEMIIVDTGSKDSTVDIANRYGAKVHFFPWNNSFSDARNESLKYATCDWILMMDADDELESLDKPKLLDLMRNNDADAYFFETISYIGDVPGADVMMNLNLRLMENWKGYRYTNIIHEQLYSNILAVNPNAKILNEHIKVYHYGYLNKNISHHDKRGRNIALLEKELEMNHGHPFTYFNLASEYFAKNDNAKALEIFEKAYTNFNPYEGFSSKLVLKMASCYINLGRYDEALKYINENFKYYPDFTDLEYLKGLISKFQGKHIQAIKHFKKCIEMGEAPIYLNVIIGAGNFKTYLELGYIYHFHEEYDSAVEFYEKALESNKALSFVLRELIGSYCRKKPGEKALGKIIERLRPYQPDKFEALVIEVLIEEKHYDLALRYIKKYEKRYASSPFSKYFKGICNLYLKKYDYSLSVMESLDNDPEYCTKALCCQALCRIIQKQYPSAEQILESGNIDKNSPLVKVYKAFYDIVSTGSCKVLSESEKDSPSFTECIFDILNILLRVYEFELFEKALGLLNAISDKTVLLRLAKLYYHAGSLGLAYQELIRSIQLCSIIDAEGAHMLYRLKFKGF